MTQVLIQTYTAAHENRARITSLLLALCACAALYYGFSIYKTVSQTIALQKAEVETAALSNEVSTLDSTYIDISRTVTPDKLGEYGLSQARVTEFIPRTSSLGSVAMSPHGI